MKEHVELGRRLRWDEEAPALLSCADRRHHVYVVGKSGTRKTTLLRNMILQDPYDDTRRCEAPVDCR